MQRTASTCNLCTPEPHTTTQPGPSWIHDSQKLWKIIKWLLFQVTKFWHDLLPSIRCHGITNSRGKSKNSDRFYFLGLWITVDGDCSHEFKRCLLLGRKAMTNLDSILKSKAITLLAKVHIVKAMIFPVLMSRCESCTIKKAEHQRIDVFKLWCWKRLLRVPWTARRSNQSILKEINPEYCWKDWCWSWSSNTLATWCEELTHWKRPWFWERLRTGEEGDRGWDGWMESSLNGHAFEQPGDSEGGETAML